MFGVYIFKITTTSLKDQWFDFWSFLVLLISRWPPLAVWTGGDTWSSWISIYRNQLKKTLYVMVTPSGLYNRDPFSGMTSSKGTLSTETTPFELLKTIAVSSMLSIVLCTAERWFRNMTKFTNWGDIRTVILPYVYRRIASWHLCQLHPLRWWSLLSTWSPQAFSCRCKQSVGSGSCQWVDCLLGD